MKQLKDLIKLNTKRIAPIIHKLDFHNFSTILLPDLIETPRIGIKTQIAKPVKKPEMIMVCNMYICHYSEKFQA